MPRYYLKNLGGASKVSKFAAFGTIAYGTTLLGIAPFLTGLGLYDPIKKIVDPICKSCFQFLAGSPFLTELNKGGYVTREPFLGLKIIFFGGINILTQIVNLLEPL